MSHITRQPTVTLQGIEKGARQTKALGLRASNVQVVAGAKGGVQPKGRSTASIVLKNSKKEAAFNVYVDENGSEEFNVVKQLEKLEPRVPLSSVEDDDYDVLSVEPTTSPRCSSPIFSIGEGSEYFSVPDVILPACAFDTPAEMVDDMFKYMRLREEQFMVRLRWNKQPELNDNMRMVLIDWLHDVLTEYDMESETLHLAVSLIDRLLMMCSVSRPNVQLVGTAALMIASKYEQIHPPELKDFAYVTDDSYSENQILRMEQKILNLLRFDVSVPTVEWFVAHMMNMMKPSKKTLYLSHYLGDLSLLLSSLNGTRPSVIAASCIALSNLMTGPAAWSVEMEKTTGIRLDEMERPMTSLLNAFNAASQSEQRSIYEKYSRSNFEEVALLSSPAVLPPFH
ncbi:hypothetical protein PFISCL1PPCAC_10341 [Pristionchus fissidentatus]|uniref:Cyclin N-terminal domain-containing protein n=1 Tax=Pristionchus fissidentatus TaxID=1538716 RepID=A0AAV5VMP2_9BILA|nr:hypothetical protein PFISCL1PPCAC_10341 [Pristionchus fissidentatus]